MGLLMINDFYIVALLLTGCVVSAMRYSYKRKKEIEEDNESRKLEKLNEANLSFFLGHPVSFFLILREEIETGKQHLELIDYIAMQVIKLSDFNGTIKSYLGDNCIHAQSLLKLIDCCLHILHKNNVHFYPLDRENKIFIFERMYETVESILKKIDEEKTIFSGEQNNWINRESNFNE
jgi:hypothetical protein